MDDIDDVVIEDSTEDGDTGTPEQKLKQLRDKLKAAQAEANDNLAGWQRSKADYVNLAKRMREMEESMTRAGSIGVVGGLVDVFDSIEASGHPAILKQLDAALARLGVTRFRPDTGTSFDPNVHEAVSAVATSEKSEDNTIHSVMQSGYAQADITVRPARVTVYHFQ
jgi:molecular chaperone GrpE